MLRAIALSLAVIIGAATVAIPQSSELALRQAFVELDGILAGPASTVGECKAMLERVREWRGRMDAVLNARDAVISIIEPEDGATVPCRPLCEGTANRPGAEVWMIIHPMDMPDYWAQQPATVRADSTWRLIPNIGREGMDIGDRFEIRVFLNPEIELQEGKTSGWPEAEAESEIIEVVRR